MPAASDILQFFGGQIFQTPQLPNTSFSGKTVVITGANQGLGFECAKHLVQLNVSTLILGCRSIAKGEAAKQKLLSLSNGKIDIQVWQIDMANYASVQAFGEKISRELPRLDALIANAAISTNQYNVAEGLEETLTVNIVATFLLALLVLPVLEHTAMQNGVPSHLTIVGSVVHCFAADQQLQEPPAGEVFATLSDEKKADMAARYFLSKLIVLQCIQELAKRVRNTKAGSPSVIINCPNPGWCKTELFRTDDGGFFGRNMLRLIGRTSEVGARTLTSAIAAGEETHGRYLSECQVKPPSVFVRSEKGLQVQTKVWNELLQLLDTISPGVTDVLA